MASGLAVAWLAIAPARADIELPTVPPAQPEPATAKVFVGESVEIPLRGVTRSGLQVEFLLRRPPPRLGTLSAITPTSRGTATVVYTHDAAAGPGTDHFRYAVRAPGGGISAAAEVTVTVVERPAIFSAPKRLDFPDVALGGSARQEFEIRNDGGSRIEGQFGVPEPWKLAAGDGRYALGPGESAKFELVFTPTEDRSFSGIGTFSHDPVLGLGLSGCGYAPIEVVPREVRLEGDGQGEVRTGEFLLRNVSGDDRELRLAAPAEVVVQDAVKVPAKSETHVALHTRAGFLGSLAGKLTVSGQNVRFDVPLRVAAAPAKLLVHPEKVDFGRLVAGRYGRVKLTVRNIGGSPAELRVTLPAGATLDPDPSYEALAPGAAREFELSYARAAAATLDAPLSIEAGAVALDVPLKGQVVEERGEALAAAEGTAPGGKPVELSNLPPVPEIRFGQTKTRLDLFWKRSSPDIVRYVLIMRQIDFPAGGEPVFKYVPLTRVKPRFVRDEVRATLEGLRPGEHITLLVVGYDAAGRPTQPSPPFVVFTKPSVPWRIPWFWIGMLALAGFGVVLGRERLRARAARDAGPVNPGGF